MKLTHKTILERTWKNKCFPFLLMGIIIPLCCWVMCAFAIAGLLISALLFVLFFALFTHGYMGYLKVKRGGYVIYKQECTSVYSVANTVDGDEIKTNYSVFGDVGEYKHKGTDTHMPIINQGEMYYLVILDGGTKISVIFAADKYEIDSNIYFSEDQHLYIPRLG